jgi:hypothetical protein
MPDFISLFLATRTPVLTNCKCRYTQNKYNKILNQFDQTQLYQEHLNNNNNEKIINNLLFHGNFDY